MIARVWHGVTAAEKADGYLDYLNETGVPDYRGTGGTGTFTCCAGSRTTVRTF